MTAWVPLFQTLAWASLVVFVLVYLRVPLRAAGDAITRRIERGGGVEVSVGPWFKAKLGQLDSLPHVEAAASSGTPERDGALPDWTDTRTEISVSGRCVYLVHVISPSVARPGWFDIFAFLVGHKRAQHGLPEDLSDVVKAEFFLGRYWGNKIFEVMKPPNAEKPIGLATSAYGPTLCVCRVHFQDGHTAVLSRYLDFEMSGVFTTSAGQSS